MKSKLFFIFIGSNLSCDNNSIYLIKMNDAKGCREINELMESIV